MKKCPNTLCNEPDHPSDAIYCHNCGSKLTKKKKWLGVIVTVIVVILSVIALLAVFSDINQSTDTYFETENNDYETFVSTTIRLHNEGVENDDFGKLEKVYANFVKRYHSIYNVSRDEVIEKYRNYNEKFGVYGKHISIRWNTLQTWKNPDGSFSVVYIEDFHIDRYDKTKYSDFVLEKHIELDEDYKITSIYDVQLSKSK